LAPDWHRGCSFFSPGDPPGAWRRTSLRHLPAGRGAGGHRCFSVTVGLAWPLRQECTVTTPRSKWVIWVCLLCRLRHRRHYLACRTMSRTVMGCPILFGCSWSP
jgi:hypothetical protein